MEDRVRRFAALALDVAEQVVPEHASRFAPRIYSQPQLLACLLLKEYLRLDYRMAEELLVLSNVLRRTLRLRRAPDHTTLWWFARHKAGADLVRAAFEETVRRAVGDAEFVERVALDSTGLWLSYCSRYFHRRANRDLGQRGWLKWAMAVWTGPQVLLAQRVRPGPCGDFPDLVPLAGAAFAQRPFTELVADAGYDSEANHAYCRETLGVHSLIRAKPRRSAAVVATTPYRREMCRVLGDGGDERCRAAYRQRWIAETVMSVSKRRWGEALTSRRDATQERQALLRGVVYNLHRLVVLAPTGDSGTPAPRRRSPARRPPRRPPATAAP